MNTTKYKIVILDDNIEMLDLLNDMLNKSEINCDIYCFSDVDDNFWKLIEDVDIELFIVDIHLAGDDCRTVTERIIERKRGSVFLFISGYNYSIDSLSNFKGKCIYDFMAKPIVLYSFISRIRALLNIVESFKPLVKKYFPEYNEESIDPIRNIFIEMIKKDKDMIRSFRENMYPSLASKKSF